MEDSPKPEVYAEALKWARDAEAKYNQYKNDTPNGLETDKLCLGFTLRTILGDDRNSFAFIHDLIKDSGLIKQGQQNAIVRLAWESGVPELPEEFRAELTKAKEELENSDWTDKESFFSAKAYWEDMRQRLDDKVKEDKKLSEALEYYDQAAIKGLLRSNPKS